MGEEEVKLTKKQRKALEFKQNKSKEEREEEKKEKKRKIEDENKEQENPAGASDEQPVKKRKTRRGKKGKGVNGGKGPRFILFVGNLPYAITQEDLSKHFKNCKPDRIRIRQDKGIAFLEFDNDTREIQSKMELALRLHHSTLGNRKINVELTVGGGGNSENRLNKLKEKNEKLHDERKTRATKEEAEKSKKAANTPSGVHPSRAALIK